LSSTPAASDPPLRSIAALRLGLGAAATLFLGLFAYLAATNLFYPFELEWMEGSMVDHVARLLQGKQIYVPPSIEFAPHGYPFLFFYLSAAVATVTGIRFVPLRLVSIGATLGSFVVIFLLVRRESRSSFAGFVAAGACAGTYELGGCFFDVGRIDALFLFVFLVAIYLIRFAQSRRRALLAGAVYGLAHLTKQMALPFAPAVLLYLLLFRRRQLLPFALGSVGVAAAGTLLFDLFHDGWYSFYTLTFQTGRGVNLLWLSAYFKKDLGILAVAGLCGVFFVFSRFFWRQDRSTATFYFLLLGATVAGCGISRSLALGAFTNVLIPVNAWLAVVMALGMSEALHWAGRAATHDSRLRSLAAFVLLAVGVQMALLVYDPRSRIPSTADREAGEEFVDWRRGVDGEVLLLGHVFISIYAGQPTHVHTVGIIDAVFNETTRPYIQKSVVEAIRSKRFAAIVTDQDWGIRHSWLQQPLEESYVFDHYAFDKPDVFMPVTGIEYRPHWVYLRK